jgi:O-glycosyl hydrolase
MKQQSTIRRSIPAWTVASAMAFTACQNAAESPAVATDAGITSQPRDTGASIMDAADQPDTADSPTTDRSDIPQPVDAATDSTKPQPVDAATDSTPGARDADGDDVVATGTPDVDEVRINDTVRYQSLDGVGACSNSFPFANDLGWSWDAVKFVYDEVNFHYVRLATWFGFWEARNDDADPYHINPSGFGGGTDTANWHDVPYAQYLTGKGIETMLGIWNVSDWMAGGSPRHIAPAMYPELAESITAYLLHMKDQGVAMPVAEVQNEPGIAAALQYDTPEDLRDAALALLDMLDRHGLTNVMVHGPNFHTPPGTVPWAKVWLENQTLRDRTAAVSYHTWWSDSFTDYDQIRQLAEQYKKPVWATEIGLLATDGLQPDTWATAWDTAKSFYRAIAWSRASRLYHWASLGNDAMVGKTGERYPTFYAVKHFANFITPAARLVDTASGNKQVLALGFLLPTGNRSLILLNDSDSSKTMRIRSARGGVTTVSDSLTTSATAYDAVTAVVAPDAQGRPAVTLAAHSITSLHL